MDSVYQSDSRNVARLLALDADQDGLWRPEELGAILRHQLESRLESDLKPGDVAETQIGDKPPAGASLQTFRELFHNPRPPIHLLKLTKEFGKKNRSDPNSALPHEIATALYFVSILIALGRCRERITSLDDASLRNGAEWVLSQEWIDKPTRFLVENVSHSIRGGGEERTI